MNQRDRIWTTVIIWVVFILIAMLVFDRVLIIPVDFQGLWPPQRTMYPMAQDMNQLSEVIAAAREAGPAIFAQVQQNIHNEVAVRLPVVSILSALLLFVATASTYFIWRNAGLEAYLAREIVQAEKVKRRSRIEQFMDDLDAEELAQLRTRLTGDGSEAKTQG
jgi:hypothetical protein